MHPEYFKDKVIIITGASSGIGLASARLFGSFGANVVMAARSLDKLQELAPSVNADPDKVLCVKTDVTKMTAGISSIAPSGNMAASTSW